MSLEFFEHFLRTEISRHPSLGAALQLKSNLRRCSQQFERAVADLHYRLIKTAVQLLFSRVSSARLQELSSACSSSCETKYIITDSSHKGSPNSRSTQGTDNEQCSSRWDAQSNNSQTVRQTPRSPKRRSVNNGAGGGQQKSQTSGSRWLSRAKETKQQQQMQHQQHTHQHHQKHSHQQSQQHHHHTQQQQQHTQCNSQQQQQQQQQHTQCNSQQQQHTQCNSQQQQHTQCNSQQQQQHTQCNSLQQPQQQQKKVTCALPRSSPTRPPRPPSPPSPARPQLATREGPTYSYPGAGHHNRLAMSGWYVANMDALLSNLMRLFELIYRDTLRMCGVGDCDLRQLRNALPDPTLLSMQQRSGGAWRPNYMNCKIDFLLHLAAMVYRNTQDLRCGCECSMPADPCWPFSDKRDNPIVSTAPEHPPVQASVIPGWISRRDDESFRHNLTSNRNNAAAPAAANPGNCGCECDCRTPEELSPTPLAAPIAVHRRSRCQRRRRSRRSQSSSTEMETTSASQRPDNNSNNANTYGSSIGGGSGSRSRRRQRRRQFTKAVVRSRAIVLSSDASTATTTTTVDTARTCLSVSINMPL